MWVKYFFIAFWIFWGCTPSVSTDEKVTDRSKKENKVEHNTDIDQDTINERTDDLTANIVAELEIPALLYREKIIRHLAYTLSYSEEHEQARWVAYELTAAETAKRYERSDRFEPDPRVATGTAGDLDYKGSGYDRGHLAPAGDMSWSAQAMQESFYYSNMSPQDPGFNRGIWKRLEEQVRDWAIDYGKVYVVTGPVLKKGLPQIGVHDVTIPQSYFKVILATSGNETIAIGFLMPNSGSRSHIKYYAVSVDDVEKETGIDFFPLLENKLEQRVEARNCQECWTWNAYKANTKGSTANNGISVQCTGRTKKGLRCKRRTKNSSGRCYQHQ